MAELRATTIAGRAWLFGDDIDTDQLAPGRFMAGPIENLASHCLESVDAAFAGAVRAGDIIIAGNNFAIGSSREQAALALVHLKLGAVVARSFGGIFLRNAFNAALPAIEYAAPPDVAAGDELEIDLATGALTNHSNGTVSQLEPVPPQLLEIVYAGGLIAHLKKTMGDDRGKQGK